MNPVLPVASPASMTTATQDHQYNLSLLGPSFYCRRTILNSSVFMITISKWPLSWERGSAAMWQNCEGKEEECVCLGLLGPRKMTKGSRNNMTEEGLEPVLARIVPESIPGTAMFKVLTWTGMRNTLTYQRH